VALRAESLNRRGVNGGVADSLDEAERRMPKDASEAFYQMLEALMSARRYILAQQYYPPELLAEIDAAIRAPKPSSADT
jgi:hypothetical protein